MASNIIPFRLAKAKPGYALGVEPFDESNPVHVKAWNSIFAFGQSELRAALRSKGEG